MMKPYSPVSCTLYDELALAISRGKSIELSIEDGNAIETINVVLVDLFSKNGEEFLKIEGDRLIRLDYIRKINGEPYGKTNC
ncbi:MAG: hypothetical protein LAT57_06255 [Balneolales bacterium]|nr:hypothetical protein [Balneolales bacterium]